MTRIASALFLLTTLVGCGPTDDIANLPDAVLHARARALPVAQRYALYLRVYNSRIPRNPLLAEDVAQLGNTAWNHVMKSAIGADAGTFQAGLTVLGMIPRRCSDSERMTLRGRVQSIAGSRESERLLVDHVDSACKIDPFEGMTD